MLVALLVVAVGAVLLVALAARVIRHERMHDARLHELTARHEQQWAAHQAEAHERGRIAAELHDVVAHALDAIARRTDDPAIARTAAEARGELRRLRDLLHVGEEPTPPAALDELPALIERARADGLPVTLHVEGTRGLVPPSLEASAYRIVQETLTHVLREAENAPTSVRVVWRRTLLGVQVRVAARVPVDGLDLVGMEQRVALYDGDFRAGAQAGGAFEVTTTLPLP
jgi:signal transduction histidine kinase